METKERGRKRPRFSLRGKYVPIRFDRALSLFGNACPARLQQIFRNRPLAAGLRFHESLIGKKSLPPARPCDAQFVIASAVSAAPR